MDKVDTYAHVQNVPKEYRYDEKYVIERHDDQGATVYKNHDAGIDYHATIVFSYGTAEHFKDLVANTLNQSNYIDVQWEGNVLEINGFDPDADD